MSNTNATTPIPTLPEHDYTVNDPQEAWERFDRLVGKVLELPKQSKAAKANGKRKPPVNPKK